MVESPSKEDAQDSIITQDVCLDSEVSDRIKPRAIIFKARNNDLRKIKELIETQFPEVTILYITTGPAETILRVVKSTPLERQNSSAQPFYTIE
jgi:hypothetical protein